MAQDIFKVIFQLEAQGEGVIKELDTVAKKYGKINDEVKKQNHELQKLLKQEAEILKLQGKTKSPSNAAQYKKQLDEVQTALKKTRAEIKSLENAEKDLGKETKNLNDKLKNAFDGTKELGLKAQLKALKLELAQATDPKDVERLARAAGELQDKFDTASEAAKVFSAGDKFEQMGIALGGVGQKLLSLDFSGAREQSQLLAAASSKVTFKDAITGLKDIGSTLFNLGKALLTNPLFLIGTAIVLIVSNFDKLKNSGGLVGKVFRAIGDAIQFATDLLFKLTDVLGLTTVAFDKLNQSIIDNSKLLLERQTKAWERTIAVAKAAGIETDKLEKKQQLNAIATLGVQLKAFEQRKRIRGLLTEEEKKAELEVADAILDAKTRIQEIDAASNKKRKDDAKKYADDISKIFTDLEKRLAAERQKNAEFNAANLFGEGTAKQIKATFDIRKKLEKESFAELQKNTLKELKTKGDIEKAKALLTKIRTQQEKNFENDLNLAIATGRRDLATKLLDQSLADAQLQLASVKGTELDIARQRLNITQDYYNERIKIEEAYVAERKKLGFDTTEAEAKLRTTKLESATATFEGEKNINKLTVDSAQKTLQLKEDIEQSQLKLKNARNSRLLKAELNYEQQRLEILKAGGEEYVDEVARQEQKVAALRKEQRKQEILEYTQYFEQIVGAATQAANQIIDAKIKEIDKQTELQQKRVEDAKDIASEGNAELLQEEQKRLDDLNKEKEKFVRQQQALATVELVANTAIAVSKAAAEGGVAAGVTIAAALLALVAGLASARSIAGQAAYYEGGLFEGQGYTGNGNPRDESIALGRKPYIYHKDEFIFNHQNTRKYKDIFQGVHEGRINLRDWQDKVRAFDSFNMNRSLSIQPAIIQNNADIDELKTQLNELITVVRGQNTAIKIDSKGFTAHLKNVIAREDFIRKNAS